MQNTSFPLEILIHDDASKDGTEEIIREYELQYPEIIKPLYEKENQWIKGRRGSAIFNFPRARGKYIAFCEGDDYWTDPFKLQKQVDFLEGNPDYGLVYTDNSIYFEVEGVLIHSNNRRLNRICPSGRIFGWMLDINYIQTLTVLIRKSLIEEYQTGLLKHFSDLPLGDYPIWLFATKNSKAYYIDEPTAVYRCLKESLSHSMDKRGRMNFSIGILKVKYIFSELYNDNRKKRFQQKYVRRMLECNLIDTGILMDKEALKNFSCHNIKDFILVILYHLRINRIIAYFRKTK